MSKSDFDVIVLAGGHAGCERLWAASTHGCAHGLWLVSPKRKTGYVPTQPLAAWADICGSRRFDGLIGRVADAAAIHYRMPATVVQGREQADRVP
jgi:tRNA uridine 5-carboxymethylaminomethyl modification enzyme